MLSTRLRGRFLQAVRPFLVSVSGQWVSEPMTSVMDVRS